jgi:hypothetical protein
MTAVALKIPQEILDDAGLPYEGVRDVTAWVIAMDSIKVASGVITLASLQAQIEPLARAIRRWRLRHVARGCTLSVKGPGLDVCIDLPPNISRSQILRALHQLAAADEVAPAAPTGSRPRQT